MSEVEPEPRSRVKNTHDRLRAWVSYLLPVALQERTLSPFAPRKGVPIDTRWNNRSFLVGESASFRGAKGDIATLAPQKVSLLNA